jgi:hypothetical protein
VKFLDPLTEREMFRLTDPKILHHLPHYHNRYISKRDTFMLVASERTGTRQIYRINLPDGDAEQLTEGNDVHPYSPFLAPNDRSFFLLQGNSLKEVSSGNGREKTIYRTPQGWRMTGNLALSSDGDLAALIEMQSGHMVDGFVEQYERRAVSAATTPTSVTPGKSWPFVTICVPTSTSSSRRAKRASSAAVSSAVLTASRSSRATRASGKRPRTACSTCSVPTPTPRRSPPHVGQRGAIGSVLPQ